MLQAAKDTLYWKGKTSPLQPVLIRKFSFLLSSKVLAHYHSLIFLFFLSWWPLGGHQQSYKHTQTSSQILFSICGLASSLTSLLSSLETSNVLIFDFLIYFLNSKIFSHSSSKCSSALHWNAEFILRISFLFGDSLLELAWLKSMEPPPKH